MALRAGALIGAFALLATNSQIALGRCRRRRSSGWASPASRWRCRAAHALRRLARIVAAVIALPFALQAAAQWWRVQLWMHRAPFGRPDPVLGYDVAFYVFTLPLLDGALAWLLTLLALSA